MVGYKLGKKIEFFNKSIPIFISLVFVAKAFNYLKAERFVEAIQGLIFIYFCHLFSAFIHLDMCALVAEGILREFPNVIKTCSNLSNNFPCFII